MAENSVPTSGAEELGFQYCTLPPVKEREFGPDVAPLRLELIRVTEKKWVNGTVLHYYFFNEETDGETVRFSDGSTEFRSWVGDGAQQDVVHRAFQKWKDVGIGLEFKEVQSRDEAEIRIGFMLGDGSWSFIGRDIIDLGLSVDERTMNFGWNLTRSPDEIDTAIHEIGHTLGFPHEHQNPKAGIVWDEEAVYQLLAKPPNKWDRPKTFHNILRKLDNATIEGSPWDPDSVMHYPFPAGLILQPEEFKGGVQPAGGLSNRDVQWVQSFYPEIRGRYPELKIFKPEFLEMGAENQKNLVIKPEASRRYTIQTFGVSDSVIVLFEDVDGDMRYITGDDDSGFARNAKINVKLLRGRKYMLRVRLYYSGGTGKTTVMMW